MPKCPFKILHIMASRGNGGAETYSTDIILSLHRQGVDQCVVMAWDAPRFEEIKAAGIRTTPEVLGGCFNKLGTGSFSEAKKCLLGLLTRHIPFLQKNALAQVLEQERPDIVHCWMRRAASIMPSWDKERTIGWFGGYYNPQHFQACGHFIGVTRDIVDHMIRKGVPADRAYYVPTFPDVRDEKPVNRSEFSTPEDAFVVLALSRLHPKKGLDTLLRAARLLPKVYVWLAGEGPLRGELEKLAGKLGIEDRVRFLGWRTDRGALLRAANVCALPSRYEPFGTVILEAWAAGTPFVACKSAGPLATVTHGENGLLAEIDNEEELAAMIAKLRDDSALRERLIMEGKKTYESSYTPQAVTERMIEVYEKILSSSKT